MKPQRIQLSRKKGWRLPPNTVVVARPSKWGNPYRVGRDGSAMDCKKLFRALVERNIWSFPNAEVIRDELRGKNVACWCGLNDPCHGDDLLEIANAEAPCP